MRFIYIYFRDFFFWKTFFLYKLFWVTFIIFFFVFLLLLLFLSSNSNERMNGARFLVYRSITDATIDSTESEIGLVLWRLKIWRWNDGRSGTIHSNGWARLCFFFSNFCALSLHCNFWFAFRTIESIRQVDILEVEPAHKLLSIATSNEVITTAWWESVCVAEFRTWRHHFRISLGKGAECVVNFSEMCWMWRST